MKAFIISIVAGLVSAGLVALIGKFAPPDATPAPHAEKEYYSKPWLIIAASSFAVVAWSAMLFIVIAFFLSFFGIYHNDQFLTVIFGTLLSAGALYLVFAPLLKCNHCDRRIFVQWTREPPPFSIKFKGMEGWASIILQVILRREFMCMHCGKKYKVSTNACSK